MAFAPSLNICETETCKIVAFEDDTGNYDSSSNSTGYITTNVPEITRVQATAQGATNVTFGDGEYFEIYTPQNHYYVWCDLDGAGTDPAVASATGIAANVATGETAAQVATSINTAINAFTGWGSGDSGFTSTILNDLVTITNAQTGNVTDASTPAGTTGFTITVLQAGIWTDVATGDVTGAYVEYELPGVTYTDNTFEADGTSIVDITTDQITITAHGYTVRDQVILESENSPATLPGGLSENIVYYIINVDTNTISLATSALNATAGTAINITSTGSDTVTVKSNVIDVYSTLPNTLGTTFSVDTEDVNYATSSSFPDGVYLATYVVTGNGGGTAFTHEVYREFLLYCSNKCCVYNMIAKIPELNCSCSDVKVERALFAYTMYQALKHAAQLGQTSRAISLNDSLTLLCDETECEGCS